MSKGVVYTWIKIALFFVFLLPLQAEADSLFPSINVNIMNNIAKIVAPVERLITAGAYLMGVTFIIKALFTLKEGAEARTQMSHQRNFKEPLTYFIVGMVFVYLPTGVQVILDTTFGPSTSIMAYAPVSSGNATLDSVFGSASMIGRPLTLIIQLVGLAAFIRGWMQIARAGTSGQQPGGITKGLMHVFGGILAMNLVETLEIINNTLYG